mmetsp:Transcript_17914/g.37250  ORF Transcript_17914/g.37250 Transcript_17914/m.37250 type:complete len:97 (+) Transcript_17914:2239-2529(+)
MQKQVAGKEEEGDGEGQGEGDGEGEGKEEAGIEDIPIHVDGTPLHELSNAKLIEITGAAGLTSSIRGRLLQELELRFEEFQQLYAVEKANEMQGEI